MKAAQLAMTYLLSHSPYMHPGYAAPNSHRSGSSCPYCIVCGGSKTPDQQFCRATCCKEYKVTGANYHPLTGDILKLAKENKG